MSEVAPPERSNGGGREKPDRVARRWINAVMQEADWATAWRLTDAPFRLAQVQAWLWPQRGEPDLVSESLDDVAASMCGEGPAHPLWEEFAAVALETYHRTWQEFDLARWAVASRSRPMGPDHEVVVYTREEEAIITAREPLYVARPFLMHRAGGRWLVAHAGSNNPPVPGWPPAFPDASWEG
ncbi:MAG TPA: hypothetical protein VK988_13880 [Acidimicrobiales bacterium]|nr:hypothetical protein [Acidimicrobiales bacterium]